LSLSDTDQENNIQPL